MLGRPAMPPTLFFNILSLPWLCPFGDGFAEEGHEFSDAMRAVSVAWPWLRRTQRVPGAHLDRVKRE